MTKIILLFILIVVSSCGEKKSNIPEDVNYVIRKEEPNTILSKSNIEINLNKKVDEKILRDIAMEIRETRAEYKNLWVFYYIPNMTEGMAWASTHFTPDLEINISGSTETQDKKNSDTSNIDGEILNKWRSEKSLAGATLILYKNASGKLVMKITFKNGSDMDSEITESKVNGVTKYKDNNKHGEYYLLESNGNLGMYGENGKFDEAIKI